MNINLPYLLLSCADPRPRPGRAPDLVVLAAVGGPSNDCPAQGAQLAPHGRDRAGRSVCEDLPSVQWPADRQEENARPEADPQSRL